MTDMGATAAAVGYAGAVVVLLGVRSWRQKRATGSSGFRGLAGMKSGWPARVAGLGFLVAVLCGLASPVLASLHVLPLLRLPQAWNGDGSLWAGLGVTGASVALAVAGQQAMGESWRIGVDATESTDLITHGVFRVVRNPIFTGLVGVQVGTALMAPTWLAVAGVAALVAAVEVQTRRVEEPYLITAHGPAYLRYADRTGRFVPGLGRLRLGGSTSAKGARTV